MSHDHDDKMIKSQLFRQQLQLDSIAVSVCVAMLVDFDKYRIWDEQACLAAASTSVIPCPGTKPRISLILLKVHITSKHHLKIRYLAGTKQPAKDILDSQPCTRFQIKSKVIAHHGISHFSDDRMISIKGYPRFPFVIPPNFLTTMYETKIITILQNYVMQIWIILPVTVVGLVLGQFSTRTTWHHGQFGTAHVSGQLGTIRGQFGSLWANFVH